MKEEKLLIVEYGRELLKKGLTKAAGGNLSIYNRDRGLVAISPSGLDYFKTEEEDIVLVDLEGNIIEGRRQPSSELDMHLLVYKNRPDISALVHTHSTFATVIASLRQELPACNYLLAYAGENVRCADYASFGSRELAENALRGLEGRRAVLLANHGLLAGGEDLAKAFNVAEMVEYVAEIYYRSSSIGRPVILSSSEMKLMLEKFKTYGS